MTEPLQKHSRLPRKYVPEPSSIRERDNKGRYSTTIPQDLDPKQVLLRYVSDESTKSIAKSLGVTRQALAHWLFRVAQEEWQSVQVARALARKELAEDAIEAARRPIALARARDLLRAAQWDLERVCRRIYGQDHAQLQVQVQPVLVINVAAQQDDKTVSNQ